MEKANTRGTAGATGVVVALEPFEMAADIMMAEHWAATSAHSITSPTLLAHAVIE